MPMAYDRAVKELIKDLGILIVDGNTYMRRVTRTMLTNLGAKTIYEAADGLSAIEMIRSSDPDVVLLEWDMPVLSGQEVMRIVRSPQVFPRPNLPIIVLTATAKRAEIVEALRLGAHEFLIKPTSAKRLQDRLLAIVAKPRQMMQIGKYYVPEPRRATRPEPQALAG